MEKILQFLLSGKGSSLPAVIAIIVSTFVISDKLTSATYETNIRFTRIEERLPILARNLWSSTHMQFYNAELKRMKGEPVPDIDHIIDIVGENF